LAAQAAEAGSRVVIAFGGDGHVNEVVNGVAGTATALGIVPGGTMNVFARALGLPLDPYAAVEHLVAALDSPPRRVSLGMMDGRYFTFSAGCGFDAQAADRVERYVPNKHRFGQAFFYWSAFRVLAGSLRYRHPVMTLKGPFGEAKVAMAIATKVGPYAYLAGRPVVIAPRVRLEGGLDVFALKTMKIEQLPWYALRTVTGTIASHPDAFYATDLDWIELSAASPFARHVDGEPLPPATRVRFEVAPDQLMVLA
jgi:diacylglycerol kinase family enzyme